MQLPELTYDELKAINALPDDVTQAAVLLLDSLYMNGDLSVDQHAGIARGFVSLRLRLASAERALWECPSCGARYPTERTDTPGVKCSHCVTIDVLVKQRGEARAALREIVERAKTTGYSKAALGIIARAALEGTRDG